MYEEPASGQPSQPTIKNDVNLNEYLDGLVAAGPRTLSPRRGGRLNSTCLRLCNNHLVSLKGLGKVAYHVLDNPAELMWLDASCNQLATIDDVIIEFPKLQVCDVAPSFKGPSESVSQPSSQMCLPH